MVLATEPSADADQRERGSAARLVLGVSRRALAACPCQLKSIFRMRTRATSGSAPRRLRATTPAKGATPGRGLHSELAMRAPHPGEYLRQDILPALDMTIKDVAGQLGVSRVALSEVVNERRSVSPQMAVRLGRAFGQTTRFWMALQMEHDLSQAERQPTPPVQRLRINRN